MGPIIPVSWSWCDTDRRHRYYMDGSSLTHGIHSVNDSSSMLNNLSFLITPCFTYKYALSSIVEKSFEVIRVSLLLIIQKYVETLICTPYLLSISDNIPKAIVAWSQLYGSPAPVLSLPCLASWRLKWKASVWFLSYSLLSLPVHLSLYSLGLVDSVTEAFLSHCIPLSESQPRAVCDQNHNHLLLCPNGGFSTPSCIVNSTQTYSGTVCPLKGKVWILSRAHVNLTYICYCLFILS